MANLGKAFMSEPCPCLAFFMAFAGFGVVAGADYAGIAVEAGADYVEPTIADNLVVRGAAGTWRRNEFYAGQLFSSFAILIPAGLSVFDPEPAALDAYIAAALPIVASVALPGAKIVFGSGAARTVPEGMAASAARRVFGKSLVRVRDAAAEHGLRIVLEPLNRLETNLINSIEEAVTFLEKADIDGVDVVADLYHIQSEEEPFDVVRQYAARIGHVHIADSQRTALRKEDGPWRSFLSVLHHGGYRDTVSLECNWGPDASGEMAQALQFLRAASDALRHGS